MARKPKTPSSAAQRGETAAIDSRDGSGADYDAAVLEDGAEEAAPERAVRKPSLKLSDEDEAPSKAPSFEGEGADDLRTRIVNRLARTSRGLPALDAEGKPEEVSEEDEEEDQHPITGRIVKAGEVVDDEADAEDQGGEEEPAAEASAKKFLDIPDDGVVRLKVNGEIVEMTGADLRARAQKMLAADNYFNEAKGLIEEARKLRGQPPAQADQPDRQDEPPPPAPTKRQWDRERVAGIIEKMQVSDPVDAVDDFIAVLDEVADSGAVNQGDLIAVAKQVYEANALEERVSSEMSRAISVVGEDAFKPLREYPNPRIRAQIPSMIWSQSLQLIHAGLRAIEMPEEEFTRPGITEQDIIKGYVHYQHQPEYASKLIPLANITRYVATDLMKDLNVGPTKGKEPARGGERQRTPGSQPPAENVVQLSETRTERKRLLPSQPRATAVRTDASKPAIRRRTNAEAIADMAQQRRDGVPVRR